MTIETVKIQEYSYLVNGNMLVPNDPENRDYQLILDWINEGNIPTGDIPTDLQTAADAKQFAQQLESYTTATARLTQYVVADGREKVTESQPTGEKVWNEETEEIEDVVRDVIIVEEIEPVEPTVTRISYSEDIDAEPTEETIENPLITQDNTERADAQAIVDATPQPVIDEYNS
jgi:hypothetical protein